MTNKSNMTYARRRAKICKMINRTIILLIIVLSSLLIATACSKGTPVDTNSDQEVAQTIPETAIESDSETGVIINHAWKPDRADVEAIAKTLWGECRGVPYRSHKAAVVWCILNRVDKGGYFGNSIIEVVSKSNQFLGYNPDHPVDPELAAIAEDVLIRWHNEKEGQENVGRVLPNDYYYFVGDGRLNHFTNEWRSRNYWDWSLENPYES